MEEKAVGKERQLCLLLFRYGRSGGPGSSSSDNVGLFSSMPCHAGSSNFHLPTSSVVSVGTLRCANISWRNNSTSPLYLYANPRRRTGKSKPANDRILVKPLDPPRPIYTTLQSHRPEDDHPVLNPKNLPRPDPVTK